MDVKRVKFRSNSKNELNPNAIILIDKSNYIELKSGDHLPTSPCLTCPMLTFRVGMESAVFKVAGASTTMTGDPIRRLELPAGGSSLDLEDDSQLVTKPVYRIRGFKQLDCMAEGVEALRKDAEGEDRGRAMYYGYIELDKRGSKLVDVRHLIIDPICAHLSHPSGPYDNIKKSPGPGPCPAHLVIGPEIGPREPINYLGWSLRPAPRCFGR